MARGADTTSGRLGRERRTIEAMIALFCRDHHADGRGRLCGECSALAAYAERRLALCPFGAEKPTCVNCTVHCYRPDPRERVREVMRYAGPRMLLRHPLLTLLHVLVDSRRRSPAVTRDCRRPSAAPSVEEAAAAATAPQSRPGVV
jgi:hypothetical protein